MECKGIFHLVNHTIDFRQSEFQIVEEIQVMRIKNDSSCWSGQQAYRDEVTTSNAIEILLDSSCNFSFLKLLPERDLQGQEWNR